MDVEDLFGLIVWIVIIVASISSSKKKKAQQAGKRKKDSNPWEEALGQIPGQTTQTIRQAVNTMRSSEPAPAVTEPSQPAQPLPQQTVMPMPVAPLETPFGTITPLAPMVHTHLEPDCETHDAPGSLEYVSTEGKDPCHEEQFDERPELMPQVLEQPGITLNWTGENMVQAFIMQEVLTRPCQRRR